MDDRCHGQITRLIRETVIMLCKNGVQFQRKLTVQGVIGVTVDDGTVFLVHIDDDTYATEDIGKPAQRSMEDPGSTRHDVNHQSQAEGFQLSKPLYSRVAQYACAKQEREMNRSENNLQEESPNADSSVSASAVASVSLVEEAKFAGNSEDDDVIYVQSAPSHMSAGSSHVISGIYNPHIFSVSSAASQPEYDSLGHSASHVSESVANLGIFKGETSQFSEYLDNKTGYGQMGVTHYEDVSKSQKMLKNTPSGPARMGRGRPRKVPYIFCICRQSVNTTTSTGTEGNMKFMSGGLLTHF